MTLGGRPRYRARARVSLTSSGQEGSISSKNPGKVGNFSPFVTTFRTTSLSKWSHTCSTWQWGDDRKELLAERGIHSIPQAIAQQRFSEEVTARRSAGIVENLRRGGFNIHTFDIRD